MLIRAVDRTDVTVRPMAFQADLLLRPRFGSNMNRTIEIAERSVIKLFYTIQFGFEVSSRAGTNMAVDACDLRVSGVLCRDKLRLHWYVTALTTKIDRLGVLISFIAAERSQKKEGHSAERE